MSLTPRQLRAIRRRRQEADADAEARFQQDVAGPLMGFVDVADVAFVPPATPVGWMERGHVGGGFTYCLACAPLPPTPHHTAVFLESVFARALCVVCGRVLDTTTR